MEQKLSRLELKRFLNTVRIKDLVLHAIVGDVTLDGVAESYVYDLEYPDFDIKVFVTSKAEVQEDLEEEVEEEYDYIPDWDDVDLEDEDFDLAEEEEDF